MISLIVAMDRGRVIGKDNQLPWHLPADLAYFKNVTMGHVIVMGRKTFESIGRPLLGRENVIVTRNCSFHPKGCTVIHSIEDIKQIAAERNDELFVIGGAELFKATLSFADRLYITKIEANFPGDTFFPMFDEADWHLISCEKGPKDVKNPYDYFFLVYERKRGI